MYQMYPSSRSLSFKPSTAPPHSKSPAMPASSFFVGLTASMATSFAILERASDRRCFELRRDFNDAFIESSIYKSVSPNEQNIYSFCKTPKF